MTDAFDTPEQAEFDFDLPDDRGRWGWYKLKNPETMDAMTAKRASSFGKVIGDRTALEKWGERNAVVGMSRRPDLFSLVHGKEVKRDSTELNKLIADAKQAAGSGAAANLGTAVHGYAEQMDCGRWSLDDVPPQHRADLQAYKVRLAGANILTFPDLIERITYIPEFDVAGKFDRIVQLPDGSHVIADLKTGSIEYSIMEIEIQLALYAHGVNSSGIWSKRDKKWGRECAKVREDIAIIIHLPVGQGECTLHFIDIERGWQNAELCDRIHKARKERVKSAVFTNARNLPPAPVEAPVRPLSWHERFAAVTSREEASELYQEAKSQVSGTELSGLVALAQGVLKNLA
jgi:hypothetical protein